MKRLLLYLGGITLTNIEHGNTISLKLTRMCRDHYFVFKQMKNILRRDSMRTMYFALIHSLYFNGFIARGKTNKAVLERSFRNRHSLILILNDCITCCSYFVYITNNLPLSFAGTFQFNGINLDLCPTRQSDTIHIIESPMQFIRRLPLCTLKNME